jgi:RNA polymerase sigma factor (sigma-70 family)
MSHAAIRDYLRAAVGVNPGGPADVELLARFAASRDESAFELLVWRHAALVQRVCRAVLRDHHAAEDAAQAAFLVLARKAHTFTGRGSVVGWLYRVARRIAIRLAKDRARRPTSSAELDRVPDAAAESEASPDEVAAICAEVDRLPERYRVPVLLCFFEGLTHAEAARRTGWPIGTVAGRLARAKDLLARRLSRQGVGLAAVALAVPGGSFVGSTAQAAVAFAARGAVVPGVEPSVTRLAEGALKTMTATTWKLTAAAAAVLLAAAGAWGVATRHAAPPNPEPTAVPAPTIAAAPIAAPVPAAQPEKEKERTADAKQRARSQTNLKQIVIAMHNYHDTHGSFPANVVDANGKPILSWRVQLLPFLEQEDLYKKFKLDEPWDSENNKPLLKEMPDVFKVGIEPKDSTKTYYQAFAGPGTVFDPTQQIKITDITDGTSNTIGVVEAGPPVEWTKPADLAYDPKKDLPKLDGPFTNVLMAAGCDGAVHAIKPDVDETSLRRLVERADGEVINFDDLKAKFPLTKEDVKEAQELLKQNEKLFTAIAEQLREQQKLLEQAVKQNPNGIKGIDLQRWVGAKMELERVLEELKRETEELRKELGGEKKEVVPPATPKKD